MSNVPLYPVFLSLKHTACLIAGFGRVGKRKLAGLIPSAPLSISIFDPFADAPEFSGSNIIFYNRPCSRDDIKKATLVFACADENENARIAAICEESRILCDAASDPGRGSFIVPAVARVGDLAVAVSTSGGSPAFARKMKTELRDWLKSRYRTAKLLKALRPLILMEIGEQSEREKIFYDLIESPLPELLDGDSIANRAACLDCLVSRLPFLKRDRLAALLERV